MRIAELSPPNHPTIANFVLRIGAYQGQENQLSSTPGGSQVVNSQFAIRNQKFFR